ncbi:unnamed protein product [Meganyctiphanes norvegica]|uniref:Uncharacterized protein n=1 Tax=Meganyctiphanes norvegica TaxID=48144 RepID=A0AAV2S869_MEGNR
MTRQRFYSCVMGDDHTTKGQVPERDVNRSENVESNKDQNQCPKSISKKRPRTKTHAKFVPMANRESMIQLRKNYLKRKESEPTDDLTEVSVGFEEVEEDKSPEPKKKKNEKTESMVKAKSPKQNKPRLEDEEDKCTTKARHNYVKKSKTTASSDKTEEEECERSPKSKKRKRMDEPLEIEEEIWSLEATIALKQLESLTDNLEIIEIINCFDVDGLEKKCFEKTKMNLRKMMQTWHEKETIITNAIHYINDGRNVEKTKALNIEELISCLIISINNRMPKMCKECNDWYRIEKGTKPIFKCIMCNVGTHDCRNIDSNALISGLVWMCPECSSVANESTVIENIKMKIITDMTNKTEKGNNR